MGENRRIPKNRKFRTRKNISSAGAEQPISTIKRVVKRRSQIEKRVKKEIKIHEARRGYEERWGFKGEERRKGFITIFLINISTILEVDILIYILIIYYK